MGITSFIEGNRDRIWIDIANVDPAVYSSSPDVFGFIGDLDRQGVKKGLVNESNTGCVKTFCKVLCELVDSFGNLFQTMRPCLLYTSPSPRDRG